jgi:electron transfer flavoprotein beta subunit
MRIAVCIKQVPNTNEVRINQETGTLIRDGVPSIINPDDKNAIEAALRLREENSGSVAVLNMGPPQAKEALKEALAMGADEAYLISDRAFGGSDTWATATIVAAALEKTGPYDVIFCGRQAIDGDTAQVGPEIAEFMDIPQVTYVKDICVKGEGFEVTRFTETGDYRLKVKAPVLFTAIKELNIPRYPSVKRIFQYYDGEDTIKVLTLEDLTLDMTQIGLKGSPTNVYRSFVPVKDKKNEIIDGINGKDKGAKMVDKLFDLKLI